MTQMQGIVSILKSDNHETTSTAAASLRRTLSADMSSKRWMAENGLSFGPVMKKIASSEQIAIDSLSSEEEDEECVNGDEKNPRRIDIWTAIMSQKAQDDSVKLPPPYVHPLVKKSASSLSEKSLKICTESLGSETGSDVFSSYSSSETGGDENKIHDFQEEDLELKKETDGEEYNNNDNNNNNKVVRYTCVTTKKAQAQAQQARSFPPPLQSLTTARTDGPSLHMHSHRIDGRLVLEAVSVPQQKYFETQRHDGRFLLTLINNPNVKTDPDPDDEIPSNQERDEVVESDFDYETRILNPQPPNNSSTIPITIQKSLVSRIAERDNENPSWAHRKPNMKTTNILPKLEVVEEEEASPRLIMSQSLPPPRTIGLPPLPPPLPLPSAATTLNSYQYFWRAKPTVASVIDPMMAQHHPPTKTKDLVLLRGNKADCFLPSLKGCKEPRRSLLMWEPFCIATS